MEKDKDWISVRRAIILFYYWRNYQDRQWHNKICIDETVFPFDRAF